MDSYPPCFDEVFVVSDLHMGGRRAEGIDFQMFARGARLAALARHVAARPAERVALVLDGDIIDSLAEDEQGGAYVAYDPARAAALVERLFEDPSFAPVWEALRHLLRVGRHLALVIGNHDLELALPAVQAALRERLAGDDAAALARLSFSTQGAGWACRVGAARVFCTHGNEVDPWNWVDYNALGQLAHAHGAGRAIDPARWQPNAGTRLVIELMNRVKARFPFVDLLKPEQAAAVGVLYALDRESARRLDWSALLRVARAHRAGSSVTGRLLGAEPAARAVESAEPGRDDALAALLGPNLRGGSGEARLGEDELLLAAERAARRARARADAPPAEGAPTTLGYADLAGGLVGWCTKEEALRRALLDWIQSDRSWDPAQPDAQYAGLCPRVAPEIDFLVTGHTHLARALPRPDGGAYFDAGTWARLLRLTPEALADEAAFSGVWDALTSGGLTALEAARIPGADGELQPLLFDRTTAVRIAREGRGARGELLRVEDAPGAPGVILAQEPGSAAFVARAEA